MSIDHFDEGFDDIDKVKAEIAAWPTPEPDSEYEFEPEPEPADYEEEPADEPPLSREPHRGPLGARQTADSRIKQRGQPKSDLPFIKGPICLEWIVGAMALRKPAVMVGLALWFKAGCDFDDFIRGKRVESIPIRVDRGVKTRFQISASQLSRGLHALEQAGLIRVVKGGAGRCPVVVIRNIQIPRLRAGGVVAKGSTTNRTLSEAQQPNNQQENSHE
jgi:hypothetical protein